MPAYSQSTIRRRSPSWMKFAGSRSLWHGTGRVLGCAGSIAAWIRRAHSRRSPNAPGALAPRAGGGARVAVDHVPGARSGWGAPACRGPPTAHRHLAIMSGLPRSACVSVRPGMNAVTRHRGLAQEGDDLGPDADRGRRRGGLALALAIDPEQRGVLARQAHDDVAAAVARAQVVVRDPAAERLGRALAAGRAASRGREGGRRAASRRRCSRSHPYHGARSPAPPLRGAAAQGPRRGHTADCSGAAAARSADFTGVGMLEPRNP